MLIFTAVQAEPQRSWLNSSRTNNIWNHEVTLTPGKDNKGCQPSCCPQTLSLTSKSSSDRPDARTHRETGATFSFLKTPLSLLVHSILNHTGLRSKYESRDVWPICDSLPWRYVVSLSQFLGAVTVRVKVGRKHVWEVGWLAHERGYNSICCYKKQININLRHQLDVFYIIQIMMLYLNRDPNHNKIFPPLKDPCPLSC